MRYPNVALTANKPTRLFYPGKCLQFVSLGAAASVGLDLEYDQQDIETYGQVGTLAKVKTDRKYASFVLTSTVDCVVDLISTMQDVTFSQGTLVTARIDTSQGSVQTREGIASALTDNALVAVTSAGQALVAANALRKSVRFYNQGPNPVAIGFTGITWAKRNIVLNLGDQWVEEQGANVAWAAVCNATETASVTVQEVLA